MKISKIFNGFETNILINSKDNSMLNKIKKDIEKSGLTSTKQKELINIINHNINNNRNLFF